MPTGPFTYTKSSLAIDKLEDEIRASSITIALDGSSALGDQLTISFKASISEAEKTTLDEIVENHDGIPYPSAPTPVTLTTGDPTKIINQVDADNALIVRAKAAKAGWTFGAIPIEFGTSRLQSDSSFYSKLVEGTDRSGITLKLYDGDDCEITTPGAFDANYATAVKTVIDFEPTYDYEIIGGTLRTETEISAGIRLWIIAVPDIPAVSGGSKEMAGGLNLNYLVPQNIFQVDGRVSKFLKYDATYHTNKIRLIFKYPAGTFERLQVVLELYRL